MKFSKEKKLHITGGLFYVAAVVFLLLNLLVWNNSKNYKTNFDCAFTRAHNIALYYFDTVDKVDGGKKTVDDLDYDR